MRHYLNIPEHGIRASYPLTLSILNHKTGVDEMNELIKGTVDHQQTWSGSISDEIRCNILPSKDTEMRLLDHSTSANPKDENGELINPAAADAFREYFDRKIERENDEQDAVYEAYLDKRDRGTAVCAAVVFDNTTGFTGMAHVDTLRGQL